jgi:hypothetical protein
MKTIPAIATGILLSLASMSVPNAFAQAPAQPNLAGYNRVVHVAVLPSIDYLLQTVAPGSTVDRIEETKGQMAVTYRTAAGATIVDAYVLLNQPTVAPPPPSYPATATTVPIPTPAPALPAVSAPAVVYVQPTTVVPYPDPNYYPTDAYSVDPYAYAAYPYPYFYPLGGIGIGFFGGGNRFNGGFRGGTGGFHRR